MQWHISSHLALLQGQDDAYIHQLDSDEYLCVVLDGHGEDRSVVDHVMQRLPQLCTSFILRSKDNQYLIELLATISEETCSMESGACISIAHLLPTGHARAVSLGDSPVLSGPIDFQSITDLRGLAPHGVGNNTSERTRVLLSGGTIYGNYILAPQGNDLLAVTRSLGDSKFLPLILREPEQAEIQLNSDEFILLCTDGFCDLCLPITKTRIDWKSGIAERHTAEELLDSHLLEYGLYDDTTVIVAYRY